MSLHQQRIMEQAVMYGTEDIADADLLTLVLGKRADKALLQLKTLLAQRGGLANIRSVELETLLRQDVEPELVTRLCALVEVARRLARPPEGLYTIHTIVDVVELVGPDMRHLDHEEMRVLVLNTKNVVVANICLYKGTVDCSVLRAAEIFRPAVVRTCPRIILVHNHPSGDPEPSPEDLLVTTQCVEAGKLLNVTLLDHVIIGNPKYISLNNRMKWS